MTKLIITYSKTGSAKDIIDKYPDADLSQVTAKIDIPHSMFKAGYVITFKKLGSHFVNKPDYNKYQEIIVILPVWMGSPAKVFTEVYNNDKFIGKNVTVYLTSLGHEIKPLRNFVKIVGPDNTINQMFIYGGKRGVKKLTEVDKDFNIVT